MEWDKQPILVNDHRVHLQRGGGNNSEVVKISEVRKDPQ